MSISANTRAWLHGLGSAFIGGTAAGFPTAIVDPQTFNVTSLSGAGHLVLVALFAGITTALAYLRKSPLPPALEQQVDQKRTVDPDGTETTTSTVKTTVSAAIIAALLLGSVSLAGCTDFERKTFQTLSASKAVIDQAQTDYESGKITKTPASYEAINKAKDAQAAAVKAFQGYQTSKLIVKSGGDLPAQQQAVAEALAQLGPLVAAVKQLYSGVK